MAHNIGIQMKQKELTKTFMMISKWKIFDSLVSIFNTLITHIWKKPFLPRPLLEIRDSIFDHDI